MNGSASVTRSGRRAAGSLAGHDGRLRVEVPLRGQVEVVDIPVVRGRQVRHGAVAAGAGGVLLVQHGLVQRQRLVAAEPAPAAGACRGRERRLGREAERGVVGPQPVPAPGALRGDRRLHRPVGGRRGDRAAERRAAHAGDERAVLRAADRQVGGPEVRGCVVGAGVARREERALVLRRQLEERLVEGLRVGRCRPRRSAAAARSRVSDSPQLDDTVSARFWLAAAKKASA